jgi:hypothetical protein
MRDIRGGELDVIADGEVENRCAGAKPG